MNKDFSDILKELRKEKGMNQEELAEELNLTRQTISNYERKERVPNKETFEKIADYFNVDMNYLYGKSSVRNAYEASLNPKISNTPSKDLIQPVSTKQYPLVGTIAAGVPILAEENIEEYISLDKKINADFCLRVSGDSMVLSYIFDGDIVFIRQQPDVENGEIAAVLIDDSTTLKKVYKHGNDVVELRAENPRYKPMLFDHHSNISIIGKAVYKLSKI